MNPRWLLKAKLWAQNPPSPAKIKFMVAIIAICLALFAVEKFFGWPAWLTPNRMRP
jgi:hypothetical protein